MRFMLGVDEAGRGPLAGPVAVGVVAVPEGFDVMKEFLGVADSKNFRKSVVRRFLNVRKRVSRGDARFMVEFESAETIDEEGIAVAVRRALARGVNALRRTRSWCTYSPTARFARQENTHKKLLSMAMSSFRLFHSPLSRRRLSATDVWWIFPNSIRCMDSKSIRAMVRRCITKC